MLPPGSLEIAVEVGQIASGPGGLEDRADALMEPLRRLVPFQAAAIYLLDPQQQLSMRVVSRGYDAAVSHYITSPANGEEIEMLGLTRWRRAMRVRDLPVPRERIHGWMEYLRPAGFREGLSVGLFAPDGRHVGLLGMNTDCDRHPTEDARDLIGVLAPLIANAVDPLRSISTVAAIVGDAVAGIVLTPAGGTLPLPGLAPHPLLEIGSAVLATAGDRLVPGRVHVSFLCPCPTADAPSAHVRVTVLAGPRDLGPGAVAVVLVSPPGDVRRLTPRELQILGLLVEGWSNQRIAAALVVAQRTVHAHLENILAKLEAATRTQAAVRALRLGLYVPRPLNGVRL
jgi:DNA-binding CsgD family transcriptional regulator